MKRLLFSFTIVTIAIYGLHAQTTDIAQITDTARINLPEIPEISVSSPQHETPLPDYLRYDEIEALFSRDPGYKNVDLQFKTNPRKKSFIHSSYSRYILPTAFIAYGVVTRTNKHLRRLDESTHYEVSEHLHSTIPVDDYMQFAPAIAVYALDMAGIAKAAHSFRDRTMVMATSHLIMGATVQGMKRTLDIERPDGSSNTSFPSGHTATAFVGAHILCREYDNVPIVIGGYAMATATGVLRVLNKKHWVSDVISGAGIGILSVEAGYLLLSPMKKLFRMKDDKKSLVVTPVIGAKSYEVGLAYRF